MLVRLSLESDFRHQRARGTGEGRKKARVETRACAIESEKAAHVRMEGDSQSRD